MGRFLEHYVAGTLQVSDFWAVHNEHRIFLSRLLSFPIVVFLQWDRFAHLVVALSVVLISVLMLLRSVWLSVPSRTAALLAFIPIVAMAFSLTRFENWALPFTDKIPTVLGLSTCVCALSARKAGWGSLLLASAGAAIASASSLGGMFVWVAFAPVVLVIGRGAFAYWCIAASAMAIAFFSNYASSLPVQESTLTSGRPGVLDSILFLFAYIGAPVGFSSPQWSIALGLVGCAVVILAGGPALRPALQAPSRYRGYWIWLGVAAFSVLTGMAVSTGRSSAYGLEAALFSRFHAFSSLFWMSAVVLTAMNASRASESDKGPNHVDIRSRSADFNWVLIVALAFCGVGFTYSNTVAYSTMVSYMGWPQRMQKCVFVAETAPDDCLAQFMPDVTEIRGIISFLKSHDLGFTAKLIRISPQGVPSATELVQKPELQRRGFRCNALKSGGRMPAGEVPRRAVDEVCDHILGKNASPIGALSLFSRPKYCIVDEWNVAGEWVQLQDGNQWCWIDWRNEDIQALTLVNQDGSLVVHAFSDGVYVPFVDGKTPKRDKP